MRVAEQFTIATSMDNQVTETIRGTKAMKTNLNNVHLHFIQVHSIRIGFELNAFQVLLNNIVFVTLVIHSGIANLGLDV